METAERTPLVYESRIKIPYAWSAGVWGSHFLSQLKDGKIVGSRCPKCRKVFVPPKKNCGQCFARCGEWVDVGPEGELVSFTEPAYESPAHPVRRLVYGLIRLKGADTALLHLLAPGLKLKIGMTVRAVFKQDRQGHILDILHFE